MKANTKTVPKFYSKFSFGITFTFYIMLHSCWLKHLSTQKAWSPDLLEAKYKVSRSNCMTDGVKISLSLSLSLFVMLYTAQLLEK